MQWLPLGQIAQIERGGNFQKKDFQESGIGCIHYGQIYTYYGVYANETLSFVSKEVANKQKMAKTGDIVMTLTSENIQDVCTSVAWLGENDIAIGGHTVIIKHNQNPKFLSYYFRTRKFQEQKNKYARGVKVIEIRPDNLAKILVPVPSIEKQDEIVKLLDKFDKIINDVYEGLPAEIEARQKQYEYYRNKLLAFKELKVA